MNQGIHPAEQCREPVHHERWSVLKHVGDSGHWRGDIRATHELIVVRECRSERTDDGRECWAMIATGFATADEAKAWASAQATAPRS
jgi:hypothetical protein